VSGLLRSVSCFCLWVGVVGCAAQGSSAAPLLPVSTAGSGASVAGSAGGGTVAAAPSGGASGAVASGSGAESAGAGNAAIAGRGVMPGAGSVGSVPPAPNPAGSGGAGAGATAHGGGGGSGSVAGSGAGATELFSFFVTSIEAMRKLSGRESGFGGDLRYGEATGLAGADKICTEIAESSLPGSGKKGWHAFLSAKAAGPDGAVVHARDRIGSGPWYDRTGRLVAMTLDALLATRPPADPAIANNLPNERGEPNQGAPDIDNHDVVTGSDVQGRYSNGVTCNDWTSTETVMPEMPNPNGFNHNGPAVGHSWPAQSGQSWIRAHSAPGCAPSVSLMQTGAGSGTGIGNGGGYGGIYCFAMRP
jgi:hypothetical protein